MRLASIVSLIFRSSAYVAGLLVFNAASSLKATIYPAPTVTASAMPHSGSAASYAADQSEAEFVSADLGSATFLDFDLGAARTVDGFVNVTNLLPSSVIGNSRLIFDTDGTPGFDSATDTVRLFGAATTGSQGQGYVNRFTPVTARYVRWEVLSVTGASLSVGMMEVAFLGTTNGSQPLTGVSVINASPALSAQYAAENAVNGIAGQGNLPGVEYASAGQGTNTSMDFDLGAVRSVTGFDFFDRLGAVDRIASFSLVFSNQSDFSSVLAMKYYTKAGRWTASDDFMEVPARYIRLSVVGAAAGANTGISEITFYSSPGPQISVEQPAGHTLTCGVISWGDRVYNHIALPSEFMDGVATVGGGVSSILTLKTDGSVVELAQMSPSTFFPVPPGNNGLVSVFGDGVGHSFALKRDGSVISWNEYGLITPPSVVQSKVISIVSVWGNLLALKSDGRVVAWGQNTYGQANVPLAAQSGVIAIAAGPIHSLALKDDGSVVAWGYYSSVGPASAPAEAQSGVSAIAAGSSYCLALKKGSVISWGSNQYDIPTLAQSNVVAIAAGNSHNLALRNDGRVVAWGNNQYGQTSVPLSAQSGVVAVSAGADHSLALKNDGSVVAWGHNGYGQSTVPFTALSGCRAISAQTDNSIALGAPAIEYKLTSPTSGPMTKSVTIRNVDSSNIVISNIGLSGGDTGDFVVNTTATQTSIPAGGIATLDITFSPAPASSETRETVLNINYAGSSNATKPIILRGTNAPVLPAIQTPAGGITSDTMTSLGGYVTSEGNPALIECGAVYSETSVNADPVIGGPGTAVVTQAPALGAFMVPVSGLKSSTEYTFKAYARNPVGTTYTFAAHFTTQPWLPPSVINPGSSNITSTSATLSATMAADGGGLVSQRGMVYSLTSVNNDPILGGTGVTRISGTGYTAITANISGLTGGATYSFKGYVTTSVGTGYTSTATFTTLSGVPKLVIEQPAGTAVSQFVSWGDNAYVELNPPSSLSGVVALAAGDQHAVALKSDGSVVAWGGNSYGQRTVPAGLGGVTAIAAGSLHTVALKSDGSVVAWGNNSRGQCSVPTNAGSDVIAIAAGPLHTVAVKRDGSVIAWGDNSVGQCTVPASLNGVIAVAAAANYTLALKSDGTLEAWGWSSYAAYSRFSVPAGLGGVVAIAAGDRHSAALKADGTVQVWGFNEYGQKDIPAGLNNVVAISAGHNHTMALKGDGSVVAWGANYQGQSYVPDRAQSSMSMITAGGNYSLASGAVTLSCGARPIGTAPVESAVTIHNTGTSALTITGVNMTGDDADDFILNTSGMATRILAGGSTSFKVAFVPSATGLRKTALRILSDDPSQGIWDAVLIATGTPVLPEITNPSISAVTALAATLGGDVTSAGGAPVTQRGVVYARTAVNADPFIGGIGTTVISTTGGTGPFTVNVTGLSGMSGYSFKAFASNGSIAYSPVATFTTGTWITSINDSGAGSLREAFANAAAHPGPDVIYVSPSLGGQTISATNQTVAGTSNDNAFVIDDPDGVTLDASELTNYLKITKPGTAGFNGRLFYVRTGSLTLRGITLENSGEAVLNAGILTLDRCTLTGNSATSGRGGALSNLGSATLTQCTITGNTAIQGGGVYSEGPLTVIHCTITRNTATDSGGGVYASQPLTLTNSIVWGNTAPSSGADIANLSTVRREGVSIVRGVRDPASLTGSGLFIDADPLLGEPAMQGGSTATMLPTLGSPAIDQATILSPSLTLDQRGGSRPLGVQPDIGAVEVNVITVTTPVDELDPPGFVGSGISLREAIRDTAYGGTIRFDRATFTGATASTNTITLTRGPLSPQRTCTLDGSLNPGGISIVYSPTVTLQPQTVTVQSGAAASFNVAVTNLSGGVMYQWRKDGINLGGKTTATLSMASTQETDEGLYDVLLTELPAKGYLSLNNVVKGAFSTVSQPASLIVDDAALTIQRGPSAAMLALGASYTLRVTAIAQASAALTYQWKKNGVTIKGATQSSYLISNAQLSHAGAYTCEVKSGTTSLTSGTAEIGVVDTRAKTLNLIAGSSFTAAVSAAGNGLSYAWKRNATALPAAANSFLIKPVATGDAGIYTCTVTGLAGVISGGCNTTLTVCDSPPAIKTPLELPAAAIGQFYFYQIPAQVIAGAPATSFLITGTLPAGITYNKSTGIISGRPTTTKPAGYPLTIKAWNLKGYSPAILATLMVNMVPSTALGTFAGPMERSPLNDNLGGRFDLTTSGSGLCSGSITLGGRPVLRFTNQLLLSAGAGDLILHANIPGITMADKTVLIAYLEVFASDQRAVLTLVHPTLGTTLTTPAWRTPWLISKTPALNNPATAFAATYTARLDAGNGGTTSPSGYGYASFTISTAGTLTLAGKLPDGSAVSGGAFVSKDGEIALFNLLYATTNRGSHVGQFTITPNTPVTNNTLAGTTTWFKPTPLASSTDTVYKAGFGPLTVTSVGAPYVAPLKGALVPGFTAVAVEGTNAKLNFTLGNLDLEAKEFPQLLRIASPSASSLTNTATIATPISNTTKMTAFTASSGLFSGSFTINGATNTLNRPAPFYGQLIKIGATTQGYGYFLLPTATSKISASPKLSGRMVLGAP